MTKPAPGTAPCPPWRKPTLDEVLDAMHERHKEEIRAIVRCELGSVSDGKR